MRQGGSIAATNSFANRRVLVVEDELLLAMEAEDALTGAGCHVLGPVPSPEAALAILEADRPDAVTLDLNLNGEMSAELAKHLRARGIPFVVVTGYGESQLRRAGLDGAPVVTKPYEARQLLSTLAAVLE